ncbi:MAG: DUF3841 domain-containing protein [Terrisporobacter sp.]
MIVISLQLVNLKVCFPNKKKIIESWKRTFDVGDLNNLDIFVVCGNLWEIKKEWLTHIVYPGENLLKYVKSQ